MTPSAYLYGAQFSRESVRADQQRRLNQMIAETERSLNRTGGTTGYHFDHARLRWRRPRPTSKPNGPAWILLRRIQPDGRIVLNLHPDDTTVDAIPDLALEDGDQFYVPSVPATVTVIGDVYNQGSFLREPGKTVNSYLRNAGGPTRDADKGRIFVVRANGGVVNKDASSTFWSGGFDGMILMPGDCRDRARANRQGLVRARIEGLVHDIV